MKTLGQDIKLSKRYLHFDNLDMSEPMISAQCSECQKQFNAVPKENERIDDLLMRIRAAYEAHICYGRRQFIN
jgi:hypothetical protein